MLLLPNPVPARGQQVEPDIVRIIAKSVPNSLQPDAVVINGSCGDTEKLLFGKRQPVRRLYRLVDIEVQVVKNEATNRQNLYAVVDWATINVSKLLHIVVPEIWGSEVG